MMVFSLIRTFFNILSNIKTLIMLAIMVVIFGFVYLLYTNGMDIPQAWSDLTGHITTIIDWCKSAWNWIVSLFTADA